MKNKIAKKTHSQLIAEQQASTKKEVMLILKTNEYDYNNTLFETGLLWLQRNYSNIPILIENNKTSRIFWKWYTNQYSIIDNAFIQKVKNESLFQLRTNTLSKIYFDLQINLSFFPSRMAQKMIHDEISIEYSKIMQQQALK